MHTWSFCRALEGPCSSSHEGTGIGVMLFCDPVQLCACNNWSSVSPPCCCDCGGWHSKPSWVHTYVDICATRLGCCYRLPIATRTLAEHKTREFAVRKDKERAIVCGHHLKNHSPFGGCLSITPATTFICTKAGEIHSESLKLPKWTDYYLWISLLICEDVFP